MFASDHTLRPLRNRLAPPGASIHVSANFEAGKDVERQTDVQFVNMAIGILAEEVTDPVKQAPLRNWAVEVINEHSKVKVDGEAKERLLEAALRVRWEASRASFEQAVRAWRAADGPDQKAEQENEAPE